MKIQWGKDKGRIILGVLFAIGIIVVGAINHISIAKCIILSVPFLLVGMISVDIKKYKTECFFIRLFFLVCSIAFLIQFAQNQSLARLGGYLCFLNICCVMILALAIFFITSNERVTFLVLTICCLGFACTNYYIHLFRGNEIMINDFLALKTAMNVVGGYKIILTAPMFYAIVLGIFINFIFFAIKKTTYKGMKIRRKVFIVGIICILFVGFGSKDIEIKHWSNQGTVLNGTVLNFAISLKELFVEKPKGYNNEIVDSYGKDYISSGVSSNENPDIIIIMDESFADFDVLGSKVNTNKEIMPFISNLSEDTIKGYALASVYGGKNPNSEFEVLTANSMQFLPQSSIPYQQFIKEDTLSLAATMKQYGYHCEATHPYQSSGWMRTTVYPYLGFDEYSFEEAYPHKQLMREYVSDQEMFETIIQDYEERDKEKGYFLFGVTMQNHGGYEYSGKNFTDTVDLKGYQKDYPDVEQYLSLAKETDKAVEYLIDYFKSVNEPVVVVFYGDHFPELDSQFYEEVHGKAFETLDEQELQYKVPFFIWANYDIEEKDVELTSLNYLSTYLMEAAGLPMTSYQRFLKDTEEVIPVINALGYYSKDKKKFLTVEEAEGKEAEALLKYHQIQYNGMFDKKNKSEVFFPTE